AWPWDKKIPGRPKGRVFFDAFIYNALDAEDAKDSVPELLLDVGVEMKAQVLSHLARYKLLAKVKVEDVSERYAVVNLAGPRIFAHLGGPSSDAFLKAPQVRELGARYATWDHRFRSPELGVRLVVPREGRVPTAYLNATELPTGHYERKLIRLGIGETSRGIVPLVSLPMECNIELLNGIHFRKGCYIGQELTIRTHHKGVVRKRLLPARVVAGEVSLTQLVGVDLYLPPDTDPRMPKPKPIGRVAWAIGDHALVLARLESLPKAGSEGLVFEFKLGDVNGRISLELFYPPWIRALPHRPT
ncbi:ccr4 associated factor, partial [Massospora cicadina]